MSMQITSYEWFDGREKGRPCLVVGAAPTAADFPYTGFKGVFLTCGDTPQRLSRLFTPHYWVNANSWFPVPEDHLDIINGLKDTVFIFSDSATYSKRPLNIEFLRSGLKIKWFAYDQRHFKGLPCKDKNLKCCELLRIYPGRVTLQEFIQKKYGRAAHYSSASTVAIHTLAFAILLGCSPIYLQGIELPRYAKDYSYKFNTSLDLVSFLSKTGNLLLRPKDWFSALRRRYAILCGRQVSAFFEDLPEILVDFQYLIDLANDNGIEVYNLSKTSTLNEIKGLRFKNPSEVKL